MISNKKLAIDFDGTIVEDAYPSIGKPKTFAFETLKKLQSEGYRLILWTYRSGKTLDDAVEFCKKNGLIGQRKQGLNPQLSGIVRQLIHDG